MSQVYVRLLAVLATGGFAACGGGDDEPTRVGEADGLATYEVESSGFSIGVPADWQAVDADEAFEKETLEAMREADPELAPILDAIAAPDSPIRLVAVDPDADDGFATNVNVVVETSSRRHAPAVLRCVDCTARELRHHRVRRGTD
jgi:hypothetical protein